MLHPTQKEAEEETWAGEVTSTLLDRNRLCFTIIMRLWGRTKFRADGTVHVSTRPPGSALRRGV